MNVRPPSERALLWISFAAEAALGPAFLVAGYAMGLVFGVGGFFYIVCCAVVVPLFIFCAGRLKLIAWQVGIASLVLSVIGDNIWNHAIFRGEIPRVAFLFWALGTLSSSPVPIYFLLRPLTPRRRCIAGAVIAGLAIALSLGLEKIAG